MQKVYNNFIFPVGLHVYNAESKLHTICCCTYVMGSKEM